MRKGDGDGPGQQERAIYRERDSKSGSGERKRLFYVQERKWKPTGMGSGGAMSFLGSH
jgi:hypothetical protein